MADYNAKKLSLTKDGNTYTIDIEKLIDDTATSGVENKTWSSAKISNLIATKMDDAVFTYNSTSKELIIGM